MPINSLITCLLAVAQCHGYFFKWTKDILVEQHTITGLESQKRNQDRVNIYLDGDYAFSLGQIIFANAGLYLGQTLTNEEIWHLKNKDEVEKAKQSAFRYLSYRQRSITEVRKNLLDKGFEEKVVDEVIDRLVELVFLDDRDFARYWVEQREVFKPRSRRAIAYELFQKGISQEIVEDVLADIDEIESARRAATKKMVSWSSLPKDQFLLKMGRFLQRRGFTYSVVNTVSNELWDSIGTDDDSN